MNMASDFDRHYAEKTSCLPDPTWAVAVANRQEVMLPTARGRRFRRSLPALEVLWLGTTYV